VASVHLDSCGTERALQKLILCEAALALGMAVALTVSCDSSCYQTRTHESVTFMAFSGSILSRCHSRDSILVRTTFAVQ
jgi:hypothetical protein